ncbi:hypothetical protein FHQ18_10940 [Deferribacter autotrophicus]|uniref:Uncharacterized protein n=1 Tax=Deferribacter autotrophicus TaxID=500465 RepID=A0A5A8F157_9BACT|nr:hypothetical protein [Deferribacter autotrophicus]KAA0257076.1 hypothetical protein FHQ18_10940 [Deferribacter autotrophicus]
MTEKEKILRGIKIRKFIVNAAIVLAFFSMVLDLIITRNFFVHVGELMLVSLLSFGFAIFMTYQIKQLRSKLEGQ